MVEEKDLATEGGGGEREKCVHSESSKLYTSSVALAQHVGLIKIGPQLYIPETLNSSQNFIRGISRLNFLLSNETVHSISPRWSDKNLCEVCPRSYWLYSAGKNPSDSSQHTRRLTCIYPISCTTNATTRMMLPIVLLEYDINWSPLASSIYFYPTVYFLDSEGQRNPPGSLCMWHHSRMWYLESRVINKIVF